MKKAGYGTVLLGLALCAGAGATPTDAAAETAWEKLKRWTAGAAVTAVKSVVRAAHLQRVFKTIAKKGYLVGPDREHALTPSAVMVPSGSARLAKGAVAPVLPRGVGGKLRSKVDLRGGFAGIRDQGGRDTSVAFAVLAAMEQVVHKRDFALSEQYAYWLFKNAETGAARCRGGASIFAAASLLHEKGVPEASAWPYTSLDPAQLFRKDCFKKETWSDGQPPKRAKRAKKYYLNRYAVLPDATDVASLVAALDAGHPIVFAVGIASTQWYAWLYLNDVIDIQVGKDKKPLPAKESHAVVLVGYDLDKKAFRIRNSWGYRWGIKGYHWLSFDYVKRYGLGAFYVTEVGTTPASSDPGAKARAEAEAAGLPVIQVHELENHGRTHKWTASFPFRPSSADELGRILAWVKERLPPGTKVKAGGARGSWTQIANSDGVYFIPDGLKLLARVAANEVKAGVRVENLFRVGAGTTLAEVNAALWGWGLSLPTQPGSDMLTIGGTLTTGTHASVLSQGPMADLARSIDLVKVDGTRVRVEPKGGITDPEAFRRTHAGWQLVQDDDVFDAALINMGTLGIVYSYVLEARPRFWMKEIRTKTTGKKAQELLRNGGIYQLAEHSTRPKAAGARGFAGGHPVPAYYLEMLWNPHSDKLIVTSRHPVDEATRAQYTRGEPTVFQHGPGHEWFRAIFQDSKLFRPHGPGLGAKLYKAAEWVVAQGAKVVPALTSKAVDMALDAMVHKDYRQRAYNVFGYGELVNKVPGQATTLTVPLRNDLYLKAIDILRRTAKEFAKRGVYQTGAISWRFVKASRAMLGNPEDVCKFEIIFSGAGKAAHDLAEKMALGYYQAVLRELGADVRFHWGHRIPAGALPTLHKHLTKSFPRYSKFDRIRRAFDPRDQLMTPWQVKLLPRVD